MWAARSTGSLSIAQGSHRNTATSSFALDWDAEPLSSPHQSNFSPKSGECLLRDVMCIVRNLLRMHEVKLALQLVDDFTTAPIASTVLSVTPDELREAFARFVSRRHSESTLEVGEDGMLELKRCAKGSGRDDGAAAHPFSSQTANGAMEGGAFDRSVATVETAVRPILSETAVHPMTSDTAVHPRPRSTLDGGLDPPSQPPQLLVEEAEGGFESSATDSELVDVVEMHDPPPLKSLSQCTDRGAAGPGGDRVSALSLGTSLASCPRHTHCSALLVEECDGICDEHPPAAEKIEKVEKVERETPVSKTLTTLTHTTNLAVGPSVEELTEATMNPTRSKKVRMLSWVSSFRDTALVVSHVLRAKTKTQDLDRKNTKSVVPMDTTAEDSVPELNGKSSAGAKVQGAVDGTVKRSAKHVNMQVNESWWSSPSNRFILSPNGTFKICWDILSLLFIVNESILVPLSLCFEVDAGDEIFWISTTFFAIDIFLSFITGYYNDGVLVMKQSYILKHYGKTWLGLDAASTFPWHLVFSSGNATMLKFVKFGKLTRVLRLLRVAKLTILIEQLEDIFASSGIVIMLKLAKILAFMGLLCHWCACGWGWLGHPSRFIGEMAPDPLDRTKCEPGGPCEPMIFGSAWRRRYGLEEKPLAEQYLYALRFAAGIFTGSDFGIQPGFWAEWLFVILLMFASFILCSTIVSKIVIIFHKMNQDRHDQEELMLSFKEFMVAGRVPFQLQAKIKRYLEFQFKSRKDLQVRRFELMEKLSPWLRKELQVHLNRSVLSLHSFFKDMPGEILAHTCCLATCVLCAPGDVVMQRGQNTQCMYFVVKGKLTIAVDGAACKSVVLNDQALRKNVTRNFKSRVDDLVESEGLVLTAPGYIGASSLFRDEVRPYTVSSLAHSELLKLAREDIEALLQEFPALRSYIEEYKVERGATEEGYQDCSLPDFKLDKLDRVGNKPKQRFKSIISVVSGKSLDG